jgi:hypothetical protein
VAGTEIDVFVSPGEWWRRINRRWSIHRARGCAAAVCGGGQRAGSRVYALRSGGAPIDVEKPRLLELEGPVFLGSIEYVRSRLAASGNRKSRADERCSFGKESELESRPRRAAG